MNYTFPEILTTRSIDERVQKVKDELLEMEESITLDEKDKECIDIYHAAETLLRGQFRGREDVLDKIIAFTIDKNRKRNYYSEECF